MCADGLLGALTDSPGNQPLALLPAGQGLLIWEFSLFLVTFFNYSYKHLCFSGPGVQQRGWQEILSKYYLIAPKAKSVHKSGLPRVHLAMDSGSYCAGYWEVPEHSVSLEEAP